MDLFVLYPYTEFISAGGLFTKIAPKTIIVSGMSSTITSIKIQKAIFCFHLQNSASARSKAGHPHHPLYLRRDSVPEPFDVRAYCAAQRARLKWRSISR